METIHFGICCSAHDPAIAIINQSGELLFAEATERSLQYKRGLNITADSYPFIQTLMQKYLPDDSTLVVAKSWSKAHHRNVKLAKAGLALASPAMRMFPLLRLVADRYDYMLKLQLHVFSFAGHMLTREWKERKARNNMLTNRNDAVLLQEKYFDHHLCHAAAAAFSSPYEKAVVAIIDGYGEMTSTAFYHFEHGRLKPIRRIRKSRNSLGFFYSFLCSACGFNPDLGEEWKVMGLAPYGKVIPELYAQLEKLIPVKEGSFRTPGPLFDIGLYDKVLHKILNNGNGIKYDIQDIASSGQQLFEDKMAESLNYLYRLTRADNLVLAGGCALNSSANGKITRMTPFKNAYVYYAPGDDGTAVGAAILSYLSQNPVSALNRKDLLSPYRGSVIEKRSLDKAVENNPFSYFLGDRKYQVTARLLSTGHIIGWVQGKAEFGPRALGNRSILADPRQAEIKDIINKKLKYRESFRPFAPSVLEEFGAEIFENYQASYYMDKTLCIKKAYQDKIRGVTHVNGTGRLQSVNKELNPQYHALLSAFHQLTGIPVLLNTSFNLSGKPIVDSMNDIMASFYTSGISALVVEDYLFTKEPFNPEA